MRRILLVLAVVVLALTAAAPAHAGWGHRHCGYGGGWGYRGWGGYGGWGGCGYGGWGYGYRGCGYGPYYSGYSIGYYRPAFVYSSGYCGGYGGFYDPLPIGYYGYYGSTYNPSSNFVGLSVSPNLAVRKTTAPTVVRNLLDMSREELLAALKTPSDRLPPTGGLKETTITAERPAVRISNAEQRRKAEQHLAVGDVLFREQKFHSALQRYKLASQTAPTWPKPIGGRDTL